MIEYENLAESNYIKMAAIKKVVICTIHRNDWHFLDQNVGALKSTFAKYFGVKNFSDMVNRFAILTRNIFRFQSKATTRTFLQA